MMKNERTPKKELKACIERRRPVGRFKGSWIDAFDRDAESMLKCKNWRRSAENKRCL